MAYLQKFVARLKQLSELGRQLYASSTAVRSSAYGPVAPSTFRRPAAELQNFARNMLHRGYSVSCRELRGLTSYFSHELHGHSSAFQSRVRNLHHFARETMLRESSISQLQGRHLSSLVQRREVGLLSCLGKTHAER